MNAAPGARRPISLRFEHHLQRARLAAVEKAMALALERGAKRAIALPVSAHWRIGQSPYFPNFGSEKIRACLIGEADRFDQGSFRFEIAN